MLPTNDAAISDVIDTFASVEQSAQVENLANEETECQDRIPPLLHSPNIRRQTPTTIGDTADVAYGADTRPSVEALPGAAESRRPAEDESVSPFA